MSSFRIVFVHGYTASSQADWYPAISQELDKLDIDYIIPDLPGGEHPKASEWLEILHHEITKSSKPLVLVGHSLGTRAVLLYIDTFKPKVERVFLISAFSNNIENGRRHDGGAYPSFFEYQINLEEIKPLVKEFIILHSKDDKDEYGIDYAQGESLAKELGAKLISFEDRRHFSESENASIILEELRNELGF